MQLKNLTIKYNSSSFTDYDGTPPLSYGAKITLDTKIGEVTTLLNEREISAIVNVIAHKVAEDMVTLSKTLAEDVRLSVENRAIEGTSLGVN